jgi:hypothetical protein
VLNLNKETRLLLGLGFLRKACAIVKSNEEDEERRELALDSVRQFLIFCDLLPKERETHEQCDQTSFNQNEIEKIEKAILKEEGEYDTTLSQLIENLGLNEDELLADGEKKLTFINVNSSSMRAHFFKEENNQNVAHNNATTINQKDKYYNNDTVGVNRNDADVSPAKRMK